MFNALEDVDRKISKISTIIHTVDLKNYDKKIIIHYWWNIINAIILELDNILLDNNNNKITDKKETILEDLNNIHDIIIDICSNTIKYKDLLDKLVNEFNKWNYDIKVLLNSHHELKKIYRKYKN